MWACPIGMLRLSDPRYMDALAVLSLALALVVSVSGTAYQLEVVLVDYVNPRGRGSEGCCEPEAAVNGQCLTQDTCDTQISIRAENLDRNSRLGDTYWLGPYEDTNSISFSNCSILGPGVPNPLVFDFFPVSYSPIETIRVIFDIWDVDFDPVENTHPTIPIAQNVYFDIVQPGSTSVVWSSIQSTRASNLPDLTIRYQYRLICIPGFCGVYCTTEALFCPVILAACNCQSNSDCSDATCQAGECIPNTKPTTAPPPPPSPTRTVSDITFRPINKLSTTREEVVRASAQDSFVVSKVIKLLFILMLFILIVIF